MINTFYTSTRGGGKYLLRVDDIMIIQYGSFLYDMFYTSTRGGGRGSERSPSLGSAHQVSSSTITFNRMQ